MPSPTLLESVRAASQEIQEFLRRQREGSPPADLTQYGPQISSLCVRLQEVGQRLQEQPGAAAGAGPEELSEYARNLQALRDALQSLTGRLLERRAEMEGERRRLKGITRWIAAARSTEPVSGANPSSLKITLGD